MTTWTTLATLHHSLPFQRSAERWNVSAITPLTPSRGAHMHGPADHRTRRRGKTRRAAACLTLLPLPVGPLAVPAEAAGAALAADVTDGLLLRYPLDAT